MGLSRTRGYGHGSVCEKADGPPGRRGEEVDPSNVGKVLGPSSRFRTGPKGTGENGVV